MNYVKQISSILTGVVVVLTHAPAISDTTFVNVLATASGGFGHVETGGDFVPGFTFTQAGQKVIISASGEIIVGTSVTSGPNGIDRVRSQLVGGFTPLEEALLDDGDPSNDPDLSDSLDEIKNFGAVIGAFVPESIINDPLGFVPRDEDLTGTAFGIPSTSLFLIGAGPHEFTAQGAGVLYLGENDSFTGNNSGAFEVTFETPATVNLIGNLADSVLQMDLATGISVSFDAKLDSALQAIDDMNDNNDGAAVNSLEAFINAVEAQRGKKLTDDQADQLIFAAEAIIAQIWDEMSDT